MMFVYIHSCIDREYTYNGIHHVPIFKKTPDADLLARLGKETPETVFSSMRWTKDTKYVSY